MSEKQRATVKRKYRKAASDKQLQAIMLHAQGLSKTAAVKKAGYKESVQRNPGKVFSGQALVSAVDKFKLELKDQGLTTQYWATKFAEWAKKGNIKEQQETYKLFKEVAIDSPKKEDPAVKRTITLTEYLNASPEKVVETAPDISNDEEGMEELKPYISDEIPSSSDMKEEEGELII